MVVAINGTNKQWKLHGVTCLNSYIFVDTIHPMQIEGAIVYNGTIMITSNNIVH